MTRTTAGLLTVCMLLAAAAQGQDDVVSQIERFDLYAGCTPVGFSLRGDFERLDELRTELLIRAEQRLTVAGIYDASERADQALVLSADVIDGAVVIRVRFMKRLEDRAWSLIVWNAQTWERMRVVLVGDYPGADRDVDTWVVGHLDEMVRAFIADYRRINVAAC